MRLSEMSGAGCALPSEPSNFHPRSPDGTWQPWRCPGLRWALAKAPKGERALSFFNIHTGERLKNAVYWADGGYVDETIEDINVLMRDYRQNEVGAIEPELLDQVFALRRNLRCAQGRFISSPATARLRPTKCWRSEVAVSPAAVFTWTVAPSTCASLATICEMCDVPPSTCSAVALVFTRVPSFVHIDTGPVRSW
jgi:hypothetical protein